MGEMQEYIVSDQRPTRREVLLLAQKIGEVCKTLEKMTEEEREICFKRIHDKNPSLLISLYHSLNKCIDD
jgi:hypothetical protein